MPFISMQEIEFNFIWVGGSKMPDLQMQNLIEIIMQNKQVQINIWVDLDQTYNALAKQMAIHMNAWIMRNPEKKPEKKYANVAFKRITKNGLQIPDELDEIIVKTQQARLWSGLSDIYRFLILSRRDDNARHARFYLEADNKMLHPLWGFFAKKDVAGVYQRSFNKALLFPPQHIRADIIFMDVNSNVGKSFAQNIRQHLTAFLCEPVMRTYFDELIDHPIKNGGLHEHDLLSSYGMIVQTMFRLQFMQANPAKIYGMEDYLIALESIREFIGPITDRAFRSWFKEGVTEIASGLLYRFVMLRMAQLSDKSGNIMKFFLDDAQRDYNVPVDSLDKFIALSEVYLRKIYLDKPLPAWFIATANNTAVSLRLLS